MGGRRPGQSHGYTLAAPTLERLGKSAPPLVRAPALVRTVVLAGDYPVEASAEWRERIPQTRRRALFLGAQV
jgi:hypothetical protein